MEIEGPYSQLCERLRLGDRGRRVAAVVPPVARQLHRGRNDRDPEEHHRRARARPAEGLTSCRRTDPWTSASARNRSCCARPRGSSSRTSAPPGSCGRAWQSPPGSPTTSGPSWPSRDGSASIYPEEYGGSGLGFVDLTVLMEEMGRVVMPGPFFSTDAPRRPDDPRGRLGGPEEGVAHPHRGRPGQDHAGVDRAERALGRGRRHRAPRARRRTASS